MAVTTNWERFQDDQKDNVQRGVGIFFTTGIALDKKNIVFSVWFYCRWLAWRGEFCHVLPHPSIANGSSRKLEMSGRKPEAACSPKRERNCYFYTIIWESPLTNKVTSRDFSESVNFINWGQLLVSYRLQGVNRQFHDEDCTFLAIGTGSLATSDGTNVKRK